MMITFRYRDEHSGRVAEREIDWQEEMGSRFPVANPSDPAHSIMLDVDECEQQGGRLVSDAIVTEPEDISFEQVLNYGFVEVPR